MINILDWQDHFSGMNDSMHPAEHSRTSAGFHDFLTSTVDQYKTTNTRGFSDLKGTFQQ